MPDRCHRQRRRPGRRSLVPMWLALGGLAGSLVFACNSLTGVDDLAICLDAECMESGAPTVSEAHAPDSAGAVGFDPEAGSDAGVTDADSSTELPDGCALCDGGACCEPDTCVVATGVCGACSEVGQPCERSADCCDRLVCTSRGTCATSCEQGTGACFETPCCIGTRCSIGFFCTSCAKHGETCSDAGACCSRQCVDGGCVGTAYSQ